MMRNTRTVTSYDNFTYQLKSERGDLDRAKRYTRYAENEMDKYETQLRYAAQADDKAAMYLRWAADALKRI